MAYYVDVYGEEEGRARIKLAKSRNLDYYQKKYGDVDGRIRWDKHLDKMRANSSNFLTLSKWSMSAIGEIKKIISDLEFFGEYEKIFYVTEEWRNKISSRIILPDLVYNNTIIEFQGDVFHANPERFSELDTPHPFKKWLTAKEMWTIDLSKKEFYESLGYGVFYIWEKDWYFDKEGTVCKCLEILTQKTKLNQLNSSVSKTQLI